MEHKSITWVACSGGYYPPNAVRGGIDSERNVYVARAWHNEGLVPGKLCVGYPFAHVSYGGSELLKNDYEILVAPPGTLSWVECSGSNIPPDAIVAGQDPNGDEYYIGRAIHDGTMTVGKVHSRYQCCYIPYGGMEHEYGNYEILVKNGLAKFLGV